MEQKDPTSFVSCVLWSLQLEPPSTCFQEKKTKAVKEGALNRDSLIKQGFFLVFLGVFLQVFPRSEGKVPRVSVSTLNDTPAAQLSGEPLFTKHGEQRREKKHEKTKNTFRLSSPRFSHLWCSYGANLLCFRTLCSATQMKMWGEAEKNEAAYGGGVGVGGRRNRRALGPFSHKQLREGSRTSC